MRALALVLMSMASLSAEARAADVSTGAAIYSRYCATCHGSGGQGDGPTASVVTIEPVDLTGLQSAAGGEFPAARVIRRIDGRDIMVSHGSPMPVYGAFFEGATKVSVDTDEGVMEVALPVLELVAFIRTIQD